MFSAFASKGRYGRGRSPSLTAHVSPLTSHFLTLCTRVASACRCRRWGASLPLRSLLAATSIPARILPILARTPPGSHSHNPKAVRAYPLIHTRTPSEPCSHPPHAVLAYPPIPSLEGCNPCSRPPRSVLTPPPIRTRIPSCPNLGRVLSLLVKGRFRGLGRVLPCSHPPLSLLSKGASPAGEGWVPRS